MTAVTAEREAPTRRNNEEETARRICFVCTGNTCRSPMAEAVTRYLAQRYRIPTVAHSAGLYAAEGDPITAHAIKALEEIAIAPVQGADYHDHVAHTLTGEEAERYDLLVGMTARHAWELLLRFPDLAGKITVMDPQVPDPFGCGESQYRQCLVSIFKGVKMLLGISVSEETDE